MPRRTFALLCVISAAVAFAQSNLKSVDPEEAATRLIKHVDPVYPPLARAARVQGTVTFKFTITESGAVTDIMLVRGHPLLVAAAKDALEQWTYKPFEENGQAISVRTSVDIPFRLDKDTDQ
jgi:protein TonB